MSIDLEWSKLDSSLATYLVTVFNKQLSTADRPSFIGPVEVTSLDFGSNASDVGLVDLRDIYRDFLNDSDDESDSEPIIGPPVKVTEGADDDEGFEWVSRRAARRLNLLVNWPDGHVAPCFLGPGGLTRERHIVNLLFTRKRGPHW